MVADKSGEDWDAYWRGMHAAAAYGAGGLHQATLHQFWGDLFSTTCPVTTHPRVLDLACGHGAVARRAIEVAQEIGGAAPAVHGLDFSGAAVAELRRNVPSILGVASDAAHTPFRDASFDVVASQFGLEYAGPGAITEAVRLVADKGVFAAVLHMKDGAIYRECALNIEVANEILTGGVLARARSAFSAGFALRDKRGPLSDFQQASEALVPAVRGLGDIMRRHGENVAGGTAKGLHQDITQMYRRLNAYYELEVLDWVTGMEREVNTYIGRMSSMLDAAIDDARFNEVVEQARDAGLTVRMQGSMRMDKSPAPAAWAFICQRA